LFDRSKGVSQRSSAAFRLLHVSADIVTAAIDPHPRLSALPLSQRLTFSDILTENTAVAAGESRAPIRNGPR